MALYSSYLNCHFKLSKLPYSQPKKVPFFGVITPFLATLKKWLSILDFVDTLGDFVESARHARIRTARSPPPARQKK